jgi:glycosyltransferase involved in cell wall biosynthesis
MLNADRNPHLFWEVVSELFTENPKFKNHLQINLIGKIAEEVNESIQKHQLKEFISLTIYVPHGDVATHLEKSQVLLLFVNDVPSAKGIVTGKVFEYFLAKRPILAIAPTDGDLSSIIKETQTGIVVGFYDKKRLKEAILNYFEAYLKNSLEIKSKNIEKYHRKNLTKQLAKLLKNN